ncbi:MAG: hypothetical protein RMX66_01590 [Planktomarina sp.]|jgi:hypothetical protein|nr:hypothetical protein [Planktomarina sp.]|tara:strand:- start:1338 stop:1607 length:270 start_codon:yes stop_codon:yes gene_type:complete
MFVTFTDWEFDNIEIAQQTAEGMWPQMQAAGATSFKATKTGENTVRSMTTWPDSATAQAAIEKMRAAALEKMSGKVTATSGGELMIDFN